MQLVPPASMFARIDIKPDASALGQGRGYVSLYWAT